MALRGAIFGVIGIVAVWGLTRFFTGGGEGLAKGDKATQLQHQVTGPSGQQVNAPAPPPKDNLTPEQRYVVDLANKGRVRLAASGFFEKKPIGVVEWVNDSGITVESLTLDALFDVGFRLNPMKYGYKLTVKDHTIIATHWPREAPKRESDASLYQLDKAGSAGADLASVASESGPAGPSRGTLISGDMTRVSGSQAGN